MTAPLQAARIEIIHLGFRHMLTNATAVPAAQDEKTKISPEQAPLA